MAQLHLNFLDIPIPETCLWEQLDDEQQRSVVEALARLLVKATRIARQEQTCPSARMRSLDLKRKILGGSPFVRLR